ncbi:MAG: hypothetical protein VW496_04980 [Pelagibacteraceae bacterium]
MSKYTDAMVAALVDRGSWDYDAAVAFASEHGLSTRSVVSKVLSLELPYTKRAAPARKTDGVTKAAVVETIEAEVGVALGDLHGLGKADRATLESLLAAVLS